MLVKPVNLVAGAALFALAACDRAPDGDGTGRVPAMAGIAGRIVDSAGHPVAGARVRAAPAEAGAPALAKSAALPARETVTDADGAYAFPDLAPGSYSLQGSNAKGTRVLYRGGVEYAGAGARVDLGADTLRRPATIRGRVVTWYADRGGALCGIPGTSFLAVTDPAGAFRIDGAPPGRYRLSYRLAGFRPMLSDTLEVPAGGAEDAPPASLPPMRETPPPPPTGFRAAYDSARGTVTLTWHPIRVPGFRHYVLQASPRDRRDYAGMAPYTLYPFLWDDTVFVDSLGRYSDVDTTGLDQDRPETWPAPFPITVSYSLGTADSIPDRQRELHDSLSITSGPRLWAQDRLLSMRRIGGQYRRDTLNPGNISSDSIAIGDTLRLAVRWRDAFLDAVKVRWGLYGNNYEPTLRVDHPGSRDFEDTLVRVVDSSVVKYGGAGIVALVQIRPWGDTLNLEVGWSAPVRGALPGQGGGR